MECELCFLGCTSLSSTSLITIFTGGLLTEFSDASLRDLRNDEERVMKDECRFTPSPLLPNKCFRRLWSLFGEGRGRRRFLCAKSINQNVLTFPFPFKKKNNKSEKKKPTKGRTQLALNSSLFSKRSRTSWQRRHFAPSLRIPEMDRA